MAVTAIFRRIPWLNHMDRHVKDVVRGGSVAFVLRMLGVGLGYGFNVLLARLLGAEGAGVYYLALTVTTIATAFGRVGLDNALLRFTAANAARGDWNKVLGVYRRGIGLAALASTVVSVITFSGAPWIAQSVFSEPALVEPLRLMALGILPWSLLTLYGELLRGLEKIASASFVQGLSIPLINIPLLLLLGRPFGVVGAVTAYVVATSLVLLLSVGLWHRATRQMKGVPASFDARLLLTTSLPLFWVTLMNLTMSWTDTLMLGIWEDSASVGIYSVAMRTAKLTSFILVAVNSIAAPKFAALYGQGDYQSLGSLARSVARLMTLLAAPILLVFIIAPSWVLRLFGPGFASGAAVLMILSFGQFVNVATGSVTYLLIMCGYEKLTRNNVTLYAILNVVLNAVLIPKFGIMGAAVATATSLGLMNLTAVALVYWKLAILTLPIPSRFIYGK